MKITRSLCPVILLLCFLSCDMYEDGPAFSFRTAKYRLTNSWKVQSCTTESGQDCTSLYADYEDHLLIDGDWIIQVSEDVVIGSGSWTLEDDCITLRYTNDEFIGADFEYTILRLTKEEMWVLTEDDMELHFTPVTG